MEFKDKALNYLRNFVNMMEFTEQNKFKISAFRNSINILKKVDIDIEESIKDGSITKIKGIGKGIERFLNELVDDGIPSEYEKLIRSIPNGILELFNIRGLGVKKVKLLNDSLKIENIDDLKIACANDTILGVKGFTEHTKNNILKEIDNIRKHSKFVLFHLAEHKAQQLIEDVVQFPSVLRAESSGGLRRGQEVISDIIIVVAVDNINNFNKELLIYSNYSSIHKSNSSIVYRLDLGFTVKTNLCVCIDEYFYSNLYITTGSDEFIKYLNFTQKVGAYNSEHELFIGNQVEFLIPEMREKEYINAPDQLKGNSNLDVSEIKGLLHFHTTFSDGTSSLNEMSLEATKLGYEYICVCDHSKSAFYANGLSEERILLQKEEISSLKSTSKVEIFHGIEADILKDGSLDYDNDILSRFDMVVASVHSNFNLSEKEMTSRIIKAIENQYTDILAHPTGRLLLSREPYEVNMKKVLEACLKNNVAIEINASPHRLDLDWRNIYFARELGCKFAINPDAHSVKSINDIKYGVKIGRKGGLQKEEVINYLSTKDFKIFLNRKVKRNFN